MNISTRSPIRPTPLTPQGVRVRSQPADRPPADYSIHKAHQQTQAPQPPVDTQNMTSGLNQSGGLSAPRTVQFPEGTATSPPRSLQSPGPAQPRIQRVRQLSSGPGPVPLAADTMTPAAVTRPVKTTQPKREVSDQKATEMGKTFQKKLKAKLESAPPKSKVGQYHRATQLLKEYAYYKRTGKGPLAEDPQARELVEANLKFLEKKVRKLAESSEVKALFKAVRKEAMQATFGQAASSVARHYANHLLSDDFSARLQKMSPADRKTYLAKETLKLAAMDPELAQKTVQKLAVKALQLQLADNINKKGPAGEKARAALKASLKQELAGYFGVGQDASDKLNKLVDHVMKTLENNPRLLLTQEGFAQALKQTAASIQASRDIPTKLQLDMQEALRKAESPGVRNGVLAAAALVNGALILGSGPQSAEDVLKGLGNVTSGVAGLGDLGRVLKVSDGALLGKLSKLGALGPLSDALGVASDVAGMFRESDNEDQVGFYLKAASAATGAASAVAGLAILAGCTSPLAPAVIAIGATVGLGTAVAEVLFAETEKTGQVRQILRDTGLSAKQDKIKAQYDQMAGITDDYRAMARHFRNLPDAESRVRFLNELLDSKDIWVSSAKANAARQMLQSLSANELGDLLDKGLHAEMLGRKIGFDAKAVKGIVQKLADTKTPAAKQALQNFLQGVVNGGHHDTLMTLLASEEFGEEMMASLSVEGLKKLVETVKDGKVAVKMLERSSWKQFNALMERSDAGMLLETIKNRLVNTDGKALIGELAAWGELPEASSKTRQRLRNWFSDFQKNSSIMANYGQAADAYVKELEDDQLKALSPELKQRLKNAFELAGHHFSSETKKRLRQFGII